MQKDTRNAPADPGTKDPRVCSEKLPKFGLSTSKGEIVYTVVTTTRRLLQNHPDDDCSDFCWTPLADAP